MEKMAAMMRIDEEDEDEEKADEEPEPKEEESEPEESEESEESESESDSEDDQSVDSEPEVSVSTPFIVFFMEGFNVNSIDTFRRLVKKDEKKTMSHELSGTMDDWLHSKRVICCGRRIWIDSLTKSINYVMIQLNYNEI